VAKDNDNEESLGQKKYPRG